MSIQNLPNELIYHILSQVDDEFVGCRCLSRQSSLASLARVSKRFVDPVRTCLYDKPLLGLKKQPSWTAAINLVDSLTMNGRALGKMVRSLEGLGRWYKSLRYQGFGSKLPYQARGCTPAFAWYLQVLRICPRTALVEVLFATQAELETVLKAIRPAASTTLNAAVFVAYHSGTFPYGFGMTFHLVLAALQAAELSNIENLYLQDLSFDFITSQIRPSIPHLLTCLSVKGLSSVSLANCIRALPRDTSELVDLFLRTSSTYPSSSLLPILNHLGPKLQKLTILLSGASFCPPTISEYRLAPQHFTFPLEPFTKFSQLRRLTLGGFVGPSPKLLFSLATTCPFLREIDFRESFWIPNEPNNADSRTTSYFRSIFQEEEVIKELSKFKHLRDLHLGYLPTTVTGEYKKLEKAMRDKGIVCQWETCRIEGMKCYYCEEYHTDYEDQ